ncbi:MAG: Fic/DOC family N-terminal domain-containing protein [Bacteroidota bacterium]|jgi:Fic family protein
MMFNPLQPYNDLPPLPPKVDLETKSVLKKAISAGRVLAELKGLGESIPNQSMLVNTVILQEAQASSEIENIVTTNDALFKAATSNTSSVDPVTKEVLRYREALWAGYNALKKRSLLTTNLYVDVVQTIKQNDAGIRNITGTAVADQRSGRVLYTPPEGEALIRQKLKELEDFIHAENHVDPLIKLALIHYQFEAIHPFFDGNGRTGRIINILYLVKEGLLDLPVLYLSKYIIEQKSDYYRLLREVTEKGKWEPWILFMLTAIESMAALTSQRIQNIRSLMQETLESAKKKLPSKVYSKELIELIFRQPYTKGQFLVDTGIAERKTAAEYLKALEDASMLKKQKVGKENLYLNKKLYVLLTK